VWCSAHHTPETDTKQNKTKKETDNTHKHSKVCRASCPVNYTREKKHTNKPTNNLLCFLLPVLSKQTNRATGLWAWSEPWNDLLWAITNEQTNKQTNDLTRANLAETNLRQANLYEAKLDGATFSATIMPDGTTEP
jgi:hypothetical protein